MSDNEPKKGSARTAARLLLWIVLALLCILLLIAVGVRIYLASSLPAPQLSREVSSYLHQQFTVEGIDSSEGNVILKGVRLHNPAGFPGGYLATADSVAIGPQWINLLRGTKRFRLIALKGIKVNLEKNKEGAWNYSQLQRILTAGKPSPKETVVEELVIRDGSLQVQGQGVQGVSLQVFNLTTKGSLDSNIDLAFQDAARTRYQIKGKARGGSDVALDLTLTAGSISLQDTAAMFRVKDPAQFAGGKGSLRVNASLHKGEFSTDGDFSFTGMHLQRPAKFPVSGVLHFAADYHPASDTAVLKKSKLTVDRLATVDAEGTVRGLRADPQYALKIAMEESDLRMLNLLVSDEARKHLLVAGRIRSDAIRLEGSRSQGLRTATGVLRLRDGALSREGRLIAAGLGGVIEVSRQGKAILAKGRLSAPGRHEEALLQSLDLPFSATISAKLKPVRAEVPALSATVMGIAVTGRAGFDAANTNPVSASLHAPSVKLPVLNDQLKRFGVRADSGTASVRVDAAGRSVQDLTATAVVDVAAFRGRRGDTALAVKKGSSTARVERRGGKLSARGDARLQSLELGGRKGDFRSGFRFADNTLYLDDAHLSSGGTDLSSSRITARIPAKEVQGNLTRYPLTADVEGMKMKQGDLAVTGLSGTIRGHFNSDSAGSWLDGTADLASRSLEMQGQKVAAPVVHALFSRSGARAETRGELLGGSLAGTVSFNPFATQEGETFDVAVTGAKIEAAAGFLPKGTTYRPTSGVIDLALKGSYSGRDGLSCRFQTKGSGISLAGSGGKTVVSGAGAAMTGTLAKGNLSISDGLLSAGEGVTLRLKGELAQALTPKRSGAITFSLPRTSLNAMVDPFINVLPRFVQEATVDGSVAAEGKVSLLAGRQLVEGGLTLKGAKLEVPSQDIVVAGLDGRLPFSIDLPGKGEGDVKGQDAISFSRENYPRLLQQLRKEKPTGELVTVDKIALGALQLGRLTLNVTAADGTTRINSIKTSLFEGALFGNGYFTMRDKPVYRADLLVNNVSLKALCSMFGGITGYITGRVDGVISLSGQGSGLAAMTGFTHLWAREGSGEKMLVSKEFLQRLAKQKLSGFLFRTDRRYDRAEIKAMLEEEDLTFDTLTIQHTNLIGVRDLSVAIAPGQNRISLDHLLSSIKEAAVRGKPATGGKPAEAPEGPSTPEFKWGE